MSPQCLVEVKITASHSTVREFTLESIDSGEFEVHNHCFWAPTMTRMLTNTDFERTKNLSVRPSVFVEHRACCDLDHVTSNECVYGVCLFVRKWCQTESSIGKDNFSSPKKSESLCFSDIWIHGKWEFSPYAVLLRCMPWLMLISIWFAYILYALIVHLSNILIIIFYFLTALEFSQLGWMLKRYAETLTPPPT